MNFSFYKSQLYQDQEFMDKQGDNFVVFNFTSHKIKPNYYPDKYPIIDFLMSVNIWAEDLDLIILRYINEIIKSSDLLINSFQPLVILPQYQPLQLLILNLVAEICHCPHPIVTYIRQDEYGVKKPFYILQSQIRKRARPERSDFQLKGLIVN